MAFDLFIKYAEGHLNFEEEQTVTTFRLGAAVSKGGRAFSQMHGHLPFWTDDYSEKVAWQFIAAARMYTKTKTAERCM